MNRSPSDMRSITAMRLPALPPGSEPDVVRETRVETDRGLTNSAVQLDEDITAPYEGAESGVNNQDSGEPIHMTLEEVKSGMIKHDPVAVTEDETGSREYVNVNVADKVAKKAPDASDSEYYNVNRYDNLKKDKNKSKDTNVDLEYAEVNVEENKGNEQKEAAKASEASANAGVQYAAIDKDRIKRKKGAESS